MVNPLLSLPHLLFLLSIAPLVLSSSPHSQETYHHRSDPLSGFKLYEGGYDVRSSHYWASTIFTGVHGYAIAVAWILGGLGFLAFLLARKKKPASSLSSSSVSSSERYCYLLLVLAIFAFTLLIMVASGSALIMSRGFHTKALKMEESVLGAAEATCHAIRRVVLAVREISGSVCPYNGPICTFLNSMSTVLRNELVTIRAVMRKNDQKFHVISRLSYGVTMGVLSLNLVLVIATIVAMIRHRSHALIMLISICWFLTGICWILTGFHFFLHTFTEDTCSALKEFEQYPSTSSLGSILPCPKPPLGDIILAEIGFGIHNVTSQLNSNMEVLAMKYGLEAQNAGLKICDPFSNAPKYNYDPGNCSSDSILVSDLLTVLEKAKPFVSEAVYSMLSAYAHSMQTFVDVFTDLQRLIHCSFLKDAFKDALSRHCKPLKVFIEMLWSSMVVLSISMSVLVVACIAKAFKDRGRSFSWEFMLPWRA